MTKRKRQKVADEKCAACGSATNKRSNHKDCPFNKKRKVDSTINHIEPLSDDCGESEEIDESFSSSADDWTLEDDIISGTLCVCGAINRAHKKSCPMSSRNYPSRVLFPPSECIPTSGAEVVKSELTDIGSTSEVEHDNLASFVPGKCFSTF